MKTIRLTAKQMDISNPELQEKFMEICRSHDLTLVDYGWKKRTTHTINGVESLDFCHLVAGYDSNGNSRNYYGTPGHRFEANRRNRLGQLGVSVEIPRNDGSEINQFFGIE